MEYLIPIILGTLAGAWMGLMPGLSASTMMIMCYPLLIGLDMVQIFSFYSSLLIVSQYTGSVSAIILGIPGEATSLPAVKEGYPLQKYGLGDLAVKVTAQYSFVGSLIALFLFYITLMYSVDFVKLYGNSIQLFFIFFCFVMLIFSCGNKWYHNAWLLLFGIFVGKIGYNGDTGTSFLTFDNPYLELGVPRLTGLIWLYALPCILKALVDQDEYEFTKNKSVVTEKMKQMILKTKYLFCGIKNSVLGFIIGLIPMTSYYVSSQIAWSLERIMMGQKYQTPSSQALVAAETSNNSAAISTLIPLMFLGVPITASEAIVFDVLTTSGHVIDINFLLDWNNQKILLLSFFIANCMGLIIAWPLARTITRYFVTNPTYTAIFSISILIFVYFFDASKIGQYWYYFFNACVFVPIGIAIRRFDLIPLVIGFMLSQRFELLFEIFLARL